MATYLFKLKSLVNELRVESLSLDRMPIAGDTLTIFNFPVVERYVIDRLEARKDWWAHDHFDRMALSISLEAVVQTAAPKSNVVAFAQDTDLETRLAKIEKVARRTVDTSLLLEICHSDFQALCQGSGLTVDIADIDAFAYHDVPMKVGEPGEWNAATSFTGYSDDRHVLYVTCPGGTPFVMNAKLLEVSKALYACKVSLDQALAAAITEAVARGCKETRGLQNAMQNMFSLMQEGIMPMYDGAQELTRMTEPRHAAPLEKIWADRSPPPVIDNARYVTMSGNAKADASGLLELFSNLKPIRH